MTPRILAILAFPALATPILSGCAALVVGSAATGGVAIAEERTLGDQVDDLTIKLAINEELFMHNEQLYQDVSINVTEGRVMLTGKVATPEDRVDAVRIAWQPEGVVEVINELQVTDSGSVGSYLNDIRISIELRTNLLFDSEVNSINFNVDTVGAVVYLTGIAEDQSELQRVVNHARTISGVKEVVSHVRVKST
ncbi:MAG: BON domain-containing protein [Rhodospirillales bacterium]|nr:BON domain-containing protein [Rhodospirillales bacterium]